MKQNNRLQNLPWRIEPHHEAAAACHVVDCLGLNVFTNLRRLVAEPMVEAVNKSGLTFADYEDVLADKRRLTRELDVAMHGEELAAKQASLCDLIEPARRMRAEIERQTKIAVDLAKKLTVAMNENAALRDQIVDERALRNAELRK